MLAMMRMMAAVPLTLLESAQKASLHFNETIKRVRTEMTHFVYCTAITGSCKESRKKAKGDSSESEEESESKPFLSKCFELCWWSVLGEVSKAHCERKYWWILAWWMVEFDLATPQIWCLHSS